MSSGRSPGKDSPTGHRSFSVPFSPDCRVEREKPARSSPAARTTFGTDKFGTYKEVPVQTLRRIGVALVLLVFVSVAGLAAPTPADLEKTPQAKAFRTQAKAAAADDYEGFKKATMAEGVAMMEKQMKEMGKTPKDGMKLMAMLTPGDIRFTDLKVDGKKATLSATGKSDGQAMKGSIDFAEEGGQWKVGRQAWESAK